MGAGGGAAGGGAPASLVASGWWKSGASGVVPPTLARKMFEMSSQRLLLMIAAPRWCFGGFGISGAVASGRSISVLRWDTRVAGLLDILRKFTRSARAWGRGAGRPSLVCCRFYVNLRGPLSLGGGRWDSRVAGLLHILRKFTWSPIAWGRAVGLPRRWFVADFT